MSISLINRIKYCPPLYKMYSTAGALALSVLKIFVRRNPKLIVFVSFGGRKFDDSPKAIYEAMTEDSRFDEYEFVWAFIEPEQHNVGVRGKKIKIDTPRYFITLLRACCWITNSSVGRGLSFSGKKTLYFNTWHGTPIKKMGEDIAADNVSFKVKKSSNVDVMLAQGKYEADIFARVFGIPRERFAVIGLPRNDELVQLGGNVRRIDELRKKLGIPADKKVILYAPTYREYLKDESNGCVAEPPVDFRKWEKHIGKDYVVLFRAHYEVVRVLNVEFGDFVRNVSDYPNLNELMLVADVLVSDYSSIFFDYSILGRPMLCFAYDYDIYAEKRGMYFDVRKELCCENLGEEENLLGEIERLDYAERTKIANAFREKYVDSAGNAADQAVDIVFERIPR